MINKVSIHNFKSLRDVDIDLERFTVFVGPNASGKTSILQALNLLCHAFNPKEEDNKLKPANWGKIIPRNTNRPSSVLKVDPELLRALLRYSNTEQQFEIVGCTARECCKYNMRHIRAAKSKASGSLFTSFGDTLVAPNVLCEEWENCNPGTADVEFSSSVLLRLDSSKLIRTRSSDSDPTQMEPDGTGLHSSLANIALSDPDSWMVLQDHLREIVPTVRRLRHNMQGEGGVPALLFDMQGADSLSASEVSEGTLLVLGILAALHSPERPNLLLLDDIDRGLHPKAQRNLVKLLRRVLDTTPDLQILATTHSPYLLGCMEPEEVRMTHLNNEGWTVCAPLTSHPEFQTWKEEMNPGEMWSLFGEQWVVDPGVQA